MNLDEHKAYIANASVFGLQGTEFDPHVENIWNDAIAWYKEQERLENKSNDASDEELAKFASFIAEGLDLGDLIEAYEQQIISKLEKLSDSQLEETKQFYGYKGQ